MYVQCKSRYIWSQSNDAQLMILPALILVITCPLWAGHQAPVINNVNNETLMCCVRFKLLICLIKSTNIWINWIYLTWLGWRRGWVPPSWRSAASSPPPGCCGTRGRGSCCCAPGSLIRPRAAWPSRALWRASAECGGSGGACRRSSGPCRYCVDK